MPKPIRLFLPLLFLSSAALAAAQASSAPNPQLAAKELNERVESLLKKMTLDEKIGQLVQHSVGDPSNPTAPLAFTPNWDQMVERGEIGAMLNVVGADATNHYQHIAVEKSRLHIPLIFGLDVLHGHRTTFPVPLGLTASWDPDAIGTVARISATEARADGITEVLAPMLDVSRDARWGRIVESAGEDPYLGSVMARAWVKGYQQDDISKPDSVAAAVKDFAAYGAGVAGRDYNAVEMGPIELRQVYLETYHAAVEAGAAAMVSGFNTIDGIPVPADRFLLTKVLRKEWGFDGIMFSNWAAVSELKNHGIGDDATVARMALEAGIDVDLEGPFGTVLAAQVRSGKIPESVVDEAVRRVLRVKFALGLFDHPYTPQSPAYQPTPEKRAIARKIAGETFVLFKNDPVEGIGPLLPLSPKLRTIALIGPMADDQRELMGALAVSGNPKDVITPKTALTHKLGDRLLYAQGCGLVSGVDENVIKDIDSHRPVAGVEDQPVLDDAELIAEAVETAKKADVAILVLGEPNNWMEGEGASRAHLGFTGAQEQLLEAVVATGKPVVLVVAAGRPLEIKWAAGYVPAILDIWSPGIEAGPALADVLFGDVNPSGKLATSLPRAVGQEPLYYAQLPTGRPANDPDRMPRTPGEKFDSRYMDEPNTALFPFGWGLSYTSFSYSQPTVSRAEVPLREVLASEHTPVVTVGVDVENTGSVAGTEVVQLYIRNTVASVSQPVRELKGFTRITLAPGELKHVELPLGFNELNFYNADIRRTVEPTTYDIWVGGSSLATAEATLKIVE
ncbi:MAG: beta-glucosidase BglX [Terracidiphilus sp.]